MSHVFGLIALISIAAGTFFGAHRTLMSIIQKIGDKHLMALGTATIQHQLGDLNSHIMIAKMPIEGIYAENLLIAQATGVGSLGEFVPQLMVFDVIRLFEVLITAGADIARSQNSMRRGLMFLQTHLGDKAFSANIAHLFGCRIGGVTLGEDGMIWYDESGLIRTMPALRVPPSQVIDTNGAGDIFHGAYVYSYLSSREKPWSEHFLFARAASTHSVRFLGIEASLPSYEDVENTQRMFREAA